MTYPPERYHRPGELEPTEQVIIPEWFVALEGEVSKLLNLPDHWDGPHSQPITLNVMAILLETINKLGIDSNSLPNLVPHSSGEVQAEWIYNEYRIEIVASADGRLSAYAAYDNGSYDIEVSEVENLGEDTIQQLITAIQNRRYK